MAIEISRGPIPRIAAVSAAVSYAISSRHARSMRSQASRNTSVEVA
jgi:hypothetical protein